MEVSGSPWYFLVWVVAYAVLNLWLPVVAKRDMDRRGQPGWRYDVMVWLILPIGLLAWWVARRRHPVVERPPKAAVANRRSS